MILKDIYLYPDLVDYPTELTSDFRYKSRSLCNYLDREVLKILKYKTDAFRRICIIGKASPKDSYFINTSNVLTIEVKFDEKEYQSLHSDQLNEYFIRLLVKGLSKIKKHIDIPETELLNGIEHFRSIGYINQWTFKKKSIRDIGVKCFLDCNLTIDNFHLNLLIYKSKELIFEKEILKMAPDELLFVPYLKDIIFDGKNLEVIDKHGKTIFNLPIDELDL